MNRKVFYWLTLEPWVHGVVKNNNVLVYNTLNKKHLVYRDVREIADIMQQLLNPNNGYVTKLKEIELNSPVIRKFIDQLRKKFMGDILESQWSKPKPFNLMHEPVIKSQKLPNLENNLREITFHVNTSDGEELIHYKKAFYQFLFPFYAIGPVRRLSQETVRSVYDQIISLRLATINFVGSWIFKEPSFGSIRGIFKESPYRRKFHVIYSQFELEDLSLGKNDSLCIYITFPVNRSHLENLIRYGRQTYKTGTIEYNFVVQNIEEVSNANEIIAQTALQNYFFKPYFNGENMHFFEDHVFISEEDVKLSRPGQHQVFSRLSMNENDYGKLTILPGGMVYANVNERSLGNLKHTNVVALIQKEITMGKSWSRIRPAVHPCSQCIYQFLCPPVSNYEVVLKRFNFCHIYP